MKEIKSEVFITYIYECDFIKTVITLFTRQTCKKSQKNAGEMGEIKVGIWIISYDNNDAFV